MRLRRFTVSIIWVGLLGTVGCVSEEEQAQRDRVATLEARYQEVAPQVEAFFEALSYFHAEGPIGPIPADTADLSPEHRAIVEALDHAYPHVLPEDTFWEFLPQAPTAEQVVMLWIDPSREISTARGMIQFLRTHTHQQTLFDVEYRLTEGEWPKEWTDPDQYPDLEERDAARDAVLAAMDYLTQLDYVIAAAPLLLDPPTMLEERNFEGGMLVARIHVYSLEEKKDYQPGYARGVPPFMAYVFGNSAESQQRSLTSQLPDELFDEIKETLRDPE